ncbi:MAG: molybdopterin-dependent oxidoreductase [Gammaproteobacteria bacterium]|nr:molybdopterin-dependent oxidoreductase [Gammaproteobacteria bacterium]
MTIQVPDSETRVLPSVCPLDCPDTCSLSVEVKDRQITAVRGSTANPYTAGVICSKVALYYPQFVHGPQRLRTPLKRSGAKGEGKFTPIGWDEALDTVYQRFSAIIGEFGAEAVAPFNYAGPHGMLAGGSMDRRFFYKLGATQLDRGPMCAGTWSAGYNSLYGAVPGMPPEQALDARLVVIWGNNTAVSNLHLHRILKTVRQNGGKIIVVDPRLTKVAKQADLHLPVLPGTDVVLAQAVAVLLEKNNGIDRDFVARHVSGFDEYMQVARQRDLQSAAEICGVEADDIVRMAELYQQLSPAAISVGIGPERNRNGGAGVRAALALPALAGKFGVRGGGIIGRSGNMFPKTVQRLQRPELLAAPTRVLNILDVPRWIENPPDGKRLRGLFIYNHNPVAVHPDQNGLCQALANEDLFTVGCDVEMNDSMRYADIILPACSHFEHDDLFCAYGQTWLQRAEPVIPPVGEALPNTEIFRRLAQRFGFSDQAFSASDAELMDDALDADDPRLGGVKPGQLPTDRALPVRINGEDAILFKNVFPQTPSGKVELHSALLEEEYDAALPVYRALEKGFPLTLITPASMRRTNATFGGADANAGMQTLEMNPLDAEARGLRDRQTVQVWNNLGKVNLRLKISAEVRPGVVCTAKGAWQKTSETGQSCNALVTPARADIAGGACYNDTLVDVSAS